MKSIPSIIFFALIINSVFTVAQKIPEKTYCRSTYKYDQANAIDLIEISADGNFTFLEYCKTSPESQMSPIGQKIKERNLKLIVTGNGKYKMESGQLILRFDTFDTHGNQSTFDFRRDTMRFLLSDLKS
ncbi:hypothetical protein [Flavobacterium silvaticum]|uniref:Uncharacterized protein n=1 Tax=Flavobacterium silvaticum TaxID=1852020 RepID=A0A972FRP5_9FLAO|nr:hypothetical protein [Flavobacterium silvaticum]NMH26767.1 hypothetical protein [Flavobacterium silvaticum]